MADEKKQETGRYHTPIFRMSFPNLLRPKAITDGAEPKYSLSMIFPKVYTPELCAKFRTTPEEQNRLMTQLKQAVLAEVVKRWGPKEKWPTRKETIDGVVRTLPAIVSPWHDGAEKDYDGYGPEVVYASASSKIKPGVVDVKMQPIIAEDGVYGGQWAHATVTVFSYDNKKMGVSFGLRNVQILRDDERFGGSSKPEDDFAAMEVPAGVAAGPDKSGVGTAPSGDGFDI